MLFRVPVLPLAGPSESSWSPAPAVLSVLVSGAAEQRKLLKEYYSLFLIVCVFKNPLEIWKNIHQYVNWLSR